MSELIKFSFAEQAVEKHVITDALAELHKAELLRQSYTEHKRDIIGKIETMLGITRAKESKAALRQFVKHYIAGNTMQLEQQLEAVNELMKSIK